MNCSIYLVDNVFVSVKMCINDLSKKTIFIVHDGHWSFVVYIEFLSNMCYCNYRSDFVILNLINKFFDNASGYEAKYHNGYWCILSLDGIHFCD